MDENQQLTRMDSAPPAISTPEPSVAEILRGIMQGGVTAENVSAVKEVVALYERMEDRKSARTSSQALRGLQAKAKSIVATRAVPDKSGGVKYKYVPYEDIMAQAQPLLNEFGFSVRYSQKMEIDRETVVCMLMHDSGHVFTNEFTVRVGSGPPGATATQADSSAGTVAQREAFCDALNIVRRRDDDARLEGGPVTQEQAEELERRLAEVNGNKAAFLKLAGAQKFSEIPAGKYGMLDEMLQRKERQHP